jgi:hypothetical protein
MSSTRPLVNTSGKGKVAICLFFLDVPDKSRLHKVLQNQDGYEDEKICWPYSLHRHTGYDATGL